MRLCWETYTTRTIIHPNYQREAQDRISASRVPPDVIVCDANVYTYCPAKLSLRVCLIIFSMAVQENAESVGRHRSTSFTPSRQVAECFLLKCCAKLEL